MGGRLMGAVGAILQLRSGLSETDLLDLVVAVLIFRL